MSRLAVIVVVLAPLSGCLLWEHGSGGTQCTFGDDTQPQTGSGGATEIATQQQRNPQDLLCQSFGGSCNPECGPCPAVALAPIPSWGVCGSACESHDEASCATDNACRVVKDARCAVQGNCVTDFLGCFPTDTFVNNTVDCLRADSQTCSENPACTAFHRDEACPLAVDGVCPRDFVLCMPEGQSPGKCFAQPACDIVSPACPPGTVAGVANNCFTGACIPQDLCEAPPP